MKNSSISVRGDSIRSRFNLLILLILLAGICLGFGGFLWYSQDIIRTLGGLVAQRNALYEKSQIIQTVARETVLVQKMARSPLIREWVRDEQDASLKFMAMDELQGFREFFHDNSFFIALRESGNYYFDGPGQSGDPTEPRYTLNPDIDKDAWFYLTLTRVPDYQLNVDTDRHLQQTKIWINAVMHDDGVAVAVLGSGLDLTEFVNRVIDGDKQGVVNILLDQDGAIQAHKDQSVIDFASIRRPQTGEERSILFDLVDSPSETQLLKQSMLKLRQGQDAEVLDLTVDGIQYIAGITYLPEIKWYLLTLTNPDLSPDRDIMLAVALLFVITLSASLLAAGYIIDKTILNPLSDLDRIAGRLAQRDFNQPIDDRYRGEFGRLFATFRQMAERIHSHTRELEQQVAERTRELQQMAYTDLLTGHLNRRGLYERLREAYERILRHGGKLGFILLDIDYFKRCNDSYGHETGDLVLAHVADILRQNLRGYDLCSRWGGEEFLIILDDIETEEQVVNIAEKLRIQVKSEPYQLSEEVVNLTISLGVCVGDDEETPDEVIRRVDAALYQAKGNGRDRVVAFSEGILESDDSL